MEASGQKSRFNRTREQTRFARLLRERATKTEKKLWPHLRSGKMGAPFRRQYSISKYFTDYACVPLKIIVEVDGPTHDAVRDSIRDDRIQHRGFEVLRFSVQEIDGNLDGVVSTIHGVVQLRLLQREMRLEGRTR
jgi:very-short-patch-repair endonuclease